MRIEVLNKDRYSEYEEFLLSNKNSLFYHSTKYKDFLEDLLGCESRYLLAYEKGKIVAALPLMIKDGPLGKVVNSLPYYGSNGSLLGTNNNNVVELFKKEIDGIKNSSITLVSSPFEDNAACFFSKITDQRISQITPLVTSLNSEKYILSIIDSSAKRNIKKAIREGIIVEENNDALEFLEKTHNENMLSIGGNAKKKDFFEKFPKYFRKGIDYKIMVANLDNEPISALLLFFYNKTVEYFTPVTKEFCKDKQPLSLILFESMQQAIKNGCHSWNWGGTWLSQNGVYQFKKKWGAVEKNYNYYSIYNNNIKNPDHTEHYYGFYLYPFGH